MTVPGTLQRAVRLLVRGISISCSGHVPEDALGIAERSRRLPAEGISALFGGREPMAAAVWTALLAAKPLAQDILTLFSGHVAMNVPGTPERARRRRGVDTSAFFNGPAIITALGTVLPAAKPRVQVISTFCVGHVPQTVLGTAKRARGLLRVATLTFSSGRARMAVIGIFKRAAVLLVAGISSCCNGHGLTVPTEAKARLTGLPIGGTLTCFSGQLPKDAPVTSKRLGALLVVDTSTCSNGCRIITIFCITATYVQELQEEDTYMCFDGRESEVSSGIVVYVTGQPLEDIMNCLNGPGVTVAPGMIVRLPMRSRQVRSTSYSGRGNKAVHDVLVRVASQPEICTVKPKSLKRYQAPGGSRARKSRRAAAGRCRRVQEGAHGMITIMHQTAC